MDDAREIVRKRVIASGRVQGVFFRDSCSAHAHLNAVSGWVRNLRDGRVEAAFEGPSDAVAAMVRWCGEGPPRARVDGIEVFDEEPEGEASFRVR